MAGITRLTVGEGLRLVRWFAFALVVGAVGLILYPITWPAYRVIEKICDALVVAGVIGLVVELSSLNSVVRRVSEEVARKTSAFHLPPAIRDQIWNIMNTKLVRHDYERRYRLSRIPGGKLSVESTITFNVRNHGTSATEYSPMLAEEDVYNPRFLHVEYGLPDGLTNAFDEKLLEQFTRERTTRARVVDGLPTVILRPLSQVPDEICAVTLRFTTVMPDEYSDITAFAGPTVDPVIQLDDMPEDLAFMSPGEGVEHVENGRRWKYKRPFLQGQHVRVWWHQRPREKLPVVLAASL